MKVPTLMMKTPKLCHPEACRSPKDLAVGFGVAVGIDLVLRFEEKPTSTSTATARSFAPQTGAQDDNAFGLMPGERGRR
jgi:hypothetical protein